MLTWSTDTGKHNQPVKTTTRFITKRPWFLVPGLYVSLYLCPWPSPDSSRRQVPAFPASASSPVPLLRGISQAPCLIGRSASQSVSRSRQTEIRKWAVTLCCLIGCLRVDLLGGRSGASVYLVPVSVEDEKTCVVGGLSSLQPFDAIPQLILNHLHQTSARLRFFVSHFKCYCSGMGR